MDKIEKIVWTEDGISSLEDVAGYIAKDSPYYASNFIKKILYSIEKLTNFPQVGRIVPEYNDPTIRELIYQNYRIVYKIKSRVIYIALVVHGFKKLPSKI